MVVTAVHGPAISYGASVRRGIWRRVDRNHRLLDIGRSSRRWRGNDAIGSEKVGLGQSGDDLASTPAGGSASRPIPAFGWKRRNGRVCLPSGTASAKAGATLTDINFDTSSKDDGTDSGSSAGSDFECSVAGSFESLLPVIDGISGLSGSASLVSITLVRQPPNPRTGASTITMTMAGKIGQ
jgi:hypothetical protein